MNLSAKSEVNDNSWLPRCVPLWAQSGETVPLFAYILSNITCRGFEYYWRCVQVCPSISPLSWKRSFIYTGFGKCRLQKFQSLDPFCGRRMRGEWQYILAQNVCPKHCCWVPPKFLGSSQQKSGAREKPERRQKNTFWYVSRFQKVGYTATTLVIILNKKRYNSRLGCDRFCETNKLNFPGRCYFWSYILCGYAA